VRVPIGLPVAVDISSKTCLVWCVGRRGLPVLPPHTVVGLGVDKPWHKSVVVILEGEYYIPSGFTKGKI
jgi:hypothetical protein